MSVSSYDPTYFISILFDAFLNQKSFKFGLMKIGVQQIHKNLNDIQVHVYRENQTYVVNLFTKLNYIIANASALLYKSLKKIKKFVGNENIWDQLKQVYFEKFISYIKDGEDKQKFVEHALKLLENLNSYPLIKLLFYPRIVGLIYISLTKLSPADKQFIYHFYEDLQKKHAEILKNNLFNFLNTFKEKSPGLKLYPFFAFILDILIRNVQDSDIFSLQDLQQRRKKLDEIDFLTYFTEKKSNEKIFLRSVQKQLIQYVNWLHSVRGDPREDFFTHPFTDPLHFLSRAVDESIEYFNDIYYVLNIYSLLVTPNTTRFLLNVKKELDSFQRGNTSSSKETRKDSKQKFLKDVASSMGQNEENTRKASNGNEFITKSGDEMSAMISNLSNLIDNKQGKSTNDVSVKKSSSKVIFDLVDPLEYCTDQSYDKGIYKIEIFQRKWKKHNQISFDMKQIAYEDFVLTLHRAINLYRTQYSRLVTMKNATKSRNFQLIRISSSQIECSSGSKDSRTLKDVIKTYQRRKIASLYNRYESIPHKEKALHQRNKDSTASHSNKKKQTTNSSRKRKAASKSTKKTKKRVSENTILKYIPRVGGKGLKGAKGLKGTKGLKGYKGLIEIKSKKKSD